MGLYCADSPVLLLCSWKLGLPVLTHPYLTMVGTVILSDLVTSSFHSQLSLATLMFLQKALLASFYSLVVSFRPVIFCGNPLREDYFSTASYFWCFMTHAKHFRIACISEGNLKSLGGGWTEWGEGISIYALPRAAQETLPLSSGCAM